MYKPLFLFCFGGGVCANIRLIYVIILEYEAILNIDDRNFKYRIGELVKRTNTKVIDV